MASTEGPIRANDRHGRRRPFTNWMKRLANLKSSHADSGLVQKRSGIPLTQKYKKSIVSKNNPYPLSGRTDAHAGLSSFTPLSSQRSQHSSLSQSKNSVSMSHDGQTQAKSRAPTLATTAETAISDIAPSGAGTSATAAKTDGDHNSTFSSPAPSLRSVTTTLTTIQSAAPPANNIATTQSISAMGPPAAAIPAHLAPHVHPTTYHSATANNALSDDASILTLASSSKRRRRNSVDTNASMRALAPASMFGGSRESLPLSVLSGAVIRERGGDDNASLRETSMRPGLGLGGERASLISASGVTAPALASERNSYIGDRPGASKYGDAASIRSGLFGGGHGRDGSLSGSIGPGGLREKREDGMLTAQTSPLVEGEPLSYQTVEAQD